VPLTVAWIVAGAMAIAVLASILPARRAARLHPVEALRYE
jgi:lipoprotein-releasing system permease protein